MNHKLLILLLCIPITSFAKLTFLGLTEDPSIDKNTFLCSPDLNAEELDTCQNRAAQAIGFKFEGPKTLPLFNNQQFWAQRKYQKRQLLMARGYKDSDLDAQMKSTGWSISGGFLVLITTDPLITANASTNLTVKNGQTKVVAQLWYNAESLIQLWAQDVAVLNEGQSFTVALSCTESEIAQQTKTNQTVSTPKNFQEIKSQFIQEVALFPQNIVISDYDSAQGSPKNIRIVPA